MSAEDIAQQYAHRDDGNYGNSETYNHDRSSRAREIQIQECPPTYLDTTLTHFPASPTLALATGFEFGVVWQPLSDLEDDHHSVPMVDLTPYARVSVIRCKSCKAYINAFCKFALANGKYFHWVCCLCGDSNEASRTHYNAYLSGCLEMQHGAYELAAPSEFCSRPPQAPAYLLLINVSAAMLEQGVVEVVCRTVQNLLNEDTEHATHNWNNRSRRTKIGVMTFSDKVQFYAFSRHEHGRVRIVEVADIHDTFLAMPSHQFLSDLSTTRNALDSLMSSLLTLHPTSSASDENAFGSAMETAFAAMKPYGGKVLVFASGLSSLGKEKLMDRSVADAGNRDVAHYEALMKRTSSWYAEMGSLCAKHQICVDLFWFSLRTQNSYCDMSTLKEVARCSGGQLLYYANYAPETDASCFEADLYRLASRPQAWESVMRVRASSPLQLHEMYGVFTMHPGQNQLIAAPTMDSSKSISFTLTHKGSSEDTDGGEVTGEDIFVQSAILFTNDEGQRRLRCFTKRIGVTSSKVHLFEGFRLSPATALIAKRAVGTMLNHDINAARLLLQNWCVQTASRYAQVLRDCEDRNRGQDLRQGFQSEADYPESLRFVPLHTLGLLRFLAFCDVRESAKWLGIDERAAVCVRVLSSNSAGLEQMIRPSLQRMDELLTLDTATLDDEYYSPPELPLSRKSMTSDGLYLLNDGRQFVLWVGKELSDDAFDTFFCGSREVPKLRCVGDGDDNCFLHKLHSLLEYAQSVNARHQSLRVVRESDDERQREFSVMHLIRDKTNSVMAYHEFLGFIHRQTASKRRRSGM